MWPALVALKELGGSATVREMYDQVVKDQGFSEEQQAVMAKSGHTSQINGTFTREAQVEASRDKASPVERIDGDRLCDLLLEYQLGVRVREEVVIAPTFFETKPWSGGGIVIPRGWSPKVAIRSSNWAAQPFAS